MFSASFPGVFDPEDTDLFRFFLGVLLVVLWLREQFMRDSFWRRDVLLFSVSFLCQRICGPLVMGASILDALLMSFSKSKWDMVPNVDGLDELKAPENEFMMKITNYTYIILNLFYFCKSVLY